MRTRYSRTLRIISAVTLTFFSWTFLSLWQIPAAIAGEKQKTTARGQSSGNPVKREQRSEEKFEGVLEAIREKVDKASGKADRGEDDTSEREAIKVKKAEIEAIDLELRKEFDATEQRLKTAKLPKEILARHAAFVENYTSNVNSLKIELDDIDKAKTSADRKAKIEKARLHLEKTKKPSKHQKLDPNNLPFKARKATKAREPRLDKKSFERDFPQQKTQNKRKLADGFLMPDLFASKPQPKPVLLAFNEIASDIPFTFDYRPAQPELAFAETSPLLLAQALDQPSADDLAENGIEIQFTDAIRAKAQELGGNPVKIYEWVRNNIEFASTYGSIQGADMCLQSRVCNDFDTASLLIALLRVSGIYAHYVYGTIEIPIEKAMNWIGGFSDPRAVINMIASGGIPVKPYASGGVITKIQIEHMWVEAWIDMIPSFGAKHKQGDTWIPLDPSFKEYNIASTLNLSKKVQFNESEYLSTQNNMPPSLAYFFTIEDYHTANYKNTLYEILYGKKIKKEEYGIFLGSLPYHVVSLGQKTPAVPDTTRHKIIISLSDPSSGDPVTVQKNVVEMAGKKITVSFNPADQQDAATITNYGGLLKTPAYILKVKPTVKIDEKVVLEGAAINPGSSMKLRLQFLSPDQGMDAIETDLVGGIYYTIGLSVSGSPRNLMSDRLDNLKNLTGTIYDSINTGDDQLGELLHNIGMQYFGQVHNASRILESLMHISNTQAISGAFVFVKASYSYLFGMPSSPPEVSGLMMDIQRYLQSPFSITGDVEQEREFTKIQGLSTSFFEHGIIENLINIESISAVKALQIAHEAGVPIYTITAANINEILPVLTVSQEVRNDIQNAVNAGKEVMISKDNILLNEWVGVGYIVRNPMSGEGAYMISSGLNGVATTQPVGGALMLLARSIAAIAEGKPADTMDITDVGLVAMDVVFAALISQMLIGRGYIPRFADSFTKERFVKLANDPQDWIFYYSGHAESDATGDHLIPGFDDNGNEILIYPQDIQADNHVVFLNACESGVNLDFVSAFGIDQMHGGQLRNEVLIGWDRTVDWFESSLVGYKWWHIMVGGETALKAAASIDKGKYTDINQYPDDPKFRIGGNQDTKLY